MPEYSIGNDRHTHLFSASDGSVRPTDGFDSAAALLPPELRRPAQALDARLRALAEEFRLRRGQTPTVLLPEGERPLDGCPPVTGAQLRTALELATGGSVHSHADSLRHGFVCAKNGVRVGVCGQAVMDSGGISGVKHLSSLSLRIPRQIRGCAANLIPDAGFFASTLLVSPPGSGKTTLLRDMVRLLSEGGLRVSLADERGEVAAVWEGAAQFDIGPRTDVLSGAPKAEAAMLLLRSMNPEVLAMDEITAPEDALACERAANCGVRLLATAHGDSLEDLRTRPLYRELLGMGVFRTVVLIRRSGADRRYEEISL
jgi:stage III sporulation protein AA